jgi:hypothetical protein
MGRLWVQILNHTNPPAHGEIGHTTFNLPFLTSPYNIENFHLYMFFFVFFHFLFSLDLHLGCSRSGFLRK